MRMRREVRRRRTLPGMLSLTDRDPASFRFIYEKKIMLSTNRFWFLWCLDSGVWTLVDHISTHARVSSL